jgi:hypothetical protein
VAVAGGLQFAYLKAGEFSTCGVTPTGIALKLVNLLCHLVQYAEGLR